MKLALQEDRTIITLDDDFGEIYYLSNEEKLKVSVIKPTKQKVSLINEILEEHLSKIEDEKYGLFIIKENQIRKLK